MKTEQLEYMVALGDDPDADVLGRLAHLDLAAAAFMAAVTRHPKRNIRMLHGERVVRQHDGEPAAEPPAPRDPNLKSWSVRLLGGKKMQNLGFVLAADEASAMKAAQEKFTSLTDAQRKRLTVNLQR